MNKRVEDERAEVRMRMALNSRRWLEGSSARLSHFIDFGYNDDMGRKPKAADKTVLCRGVSRPERFGFKP